MQIRAWLRAAQTHLSNNSDSPRRDAEILLGKVIGRSRSWLIAYDDTELDRVHLAAAEVLLARRAAGEPIAWLTGEREFWSLPLSISTDTLIPRPDSEILVEQALLHLPAYPCAILDLGTGIGSIALALASERPDCQVTGVDYIPAVVALAQQNAAKLSLKNVYFLYSNWFSALADKCYDIIVSNPPYIDATDVHLTKGDVRFEPVSALVADDQGLADIKIIATAASSYLTKKGWLLIEHGWKQGEKVRNILSKEGFRQISTCQDYGANDRVTYGIKTDE